MRYKPKSWMILLLTCVWIATGSLACGSEEPSQPTGQDCSATSECPDGYICVDEKCAEDDTDPGDAGLDADDDPEDGGDIPDDAGFDPDADTGEEQDADIGPICDEPVTCADQGALCGAIVDGCGGVTVCGQCATGYSCEDGSCVERICIPSTTCEDAQRECGPIADGCGNIINCGSCDAGVSCVAGQCVEGGCQPLSCDMFTPGDCGPHPDGCGGSVDCGFCGPGEICTTGDDRGTCQEITCNPLSCDDYTPGECGPHPDGCGGSINCGTCPSGEICGVGAQKGECLASSCVPLTCADYGDVNCGVLSDGCGGVTDSCGSCTDPEICGGGGVPNVCGADPQDGCENLCEDQVICGGGDATTLTGTVFAPNGTLPVPNAIVYVPNVPLDQLPAIESATTCVQCEDEELGSPLVGAVSDFDGTFELRHVPAGVEFPLVIKIGQWRRVVMVPPVDGCGTVALTAEQTRLPTTQQEASVHDNIPQTAVSTGWIDAMECVLFKLGVEESEFTRRTGNGRIHMYRANGGVVDQELSDACDEGFFGTCDRDYCTDRFPDSCGDSAGADALRDNLSYNLYNDLNTLLNYDMVIMDCEGSNHIDYRTADDLARIKDYVDAGGRLFASHWAYDWIYETDELQDTADWSGSFGHDYSHAFVDDSFTGGLKFWNWLKLVDADYADNPPRIEVTDPRYLAVSHNEDLATRWVYTDESADNQYGTGVQQLSFNTPVYADADQQCGQVTYSGFHVADVGTTEFGPAFPDYCGDGGLTGQEKTLAYLLFDLAACVSEGGEPPEPSCTPLTCADYDVECGIMSDGCGGVTESCGTCPDGALCGGSGVPNTCSASCAALSCEDHGAECGTIDDGCGSTIDCGTCPGDETCGGQGSPNLCGCQAITCEDHGAECGEVNDGCGGTLNCGDCTDPLSCGGGGVPNQCGGECTPLSCEDHGVECGEVNDGCGGTLDCGDCTDPLSCGGGGVSNMCGCSGLTCEDHGAQCGTVSDGCGNNLDCGGCPDDQICDDRQCVEPTCRISGAACTLSSQCCSTVCAINSGNDEGECIAL